MLMLSLRTLGDAKQESGRQACTSLTASRAPAAPRRCRSPSKAATVMSHTGLTSAQRHHLPDCASSILPACRIRPVRSRFANGPA